MATCKIEIAVDRELSPHMIVYLKDEFMNVIVNAPEEIRVMDYQNRTLPPGTGFEGSQDLTDTPINTK